MSAHIIQFPPAFMVGKLALPPEPPNRRKIAGWILATLLCGGFLTFLFWTGGMQALCAMGIALVFASLVLLAVKLIHS